MIDYIILYVFIGWIISAILNYGIVTHIFLQIDRQYPNIPSDCYKDSNYHTMVLFGFLFGPISLIASILTNKSNGNSFKLEWNPKKLRNNE